MTVPYNPDNLFAVKCWEVEVRKTAKRTLIARIYQPQGTGPFPVLIDLHGGTFTLKSEVRVGTEVIFILPPNRVMAGLAQLGDEPEPVKKPTTMVEVLKELWDVDKKKEIERPPLNVNTDIYAVEPRDKNSPLT